MKKAIYFFIICVVVLILSFILLNFKKNDINDDVNDQKDEKKTVSTTYSEIKEENLMDGISLNYHSSIRIQKVNKVIYFDPYKIDDSLNDADYIFITHSHYDHYSSEDIKKVMNDNTKFVVTSDLETKVISLGVSSDNITIVYPNNNYTVGDLKFDVITSYNIDKSYHKKSYNWVGYNVAIDGNSYYVVGDSDATDELKGVKCDVIFIPVGGVYTMTDDEAAMAVNEIEPKYAVPIHYGEVGSITNAENFVSKLNDGIKGVILK